MTKENTPVFLRNHYPALLLGAGSYLMAGTIGALGSYYSPPSADSARRLQAPTPIAEVDLSNSRARRVVNVRLAEKCGRSLLASHNVSGLSIELVSKQPNTIKDKAVEIDVYASSKKGGLAMLTFHPKEDGRNVKVPEDRPSPTQPGASNPILPVISVKGKRQTGYNSENSVVEYVLLKPNKVAHFMAGAINRARNTYQLGVSISFWGGAPQADQTICLPVK